MYQHSKQNHVKRQLHWVIVFVFDRGWPKLRLCLRSHHNRIQAIQFLLVPLFQMFSWSCCAAGIAIGALR